MSETDVVIDRPTEPETVATAVKLMLVGAAQELALGAFNAVADIHRPAVAVTSIVASVIVAWMWWQVARLCQRGRNWGRKVASVFFALNTLGLVQAFAGQFHVRYEPVIIVVNIVGWLVGLAAIVLLWRRDSGDFFGAGADRLTG